MKTTIWVTTQFEGFHRWIDAPESVSYLRNYHRHMFHVKLGKTVLHDNREIEFFTLKDCLDAFLREGYESKNFEFSCEQIASRILDYFHGDYCEVSEDGENGARVEQTIPIVDKFVVPIAKFGRKDDKSIWGLGKIESTGNEAAIKMLNDMAVKPKIDPYAELKRVKTKCFIGTEAEGPYRGCRTLFVPGSYSIDKLKIFLDEKFDWGHNAHTKIYYGAGNDLDINHNTFHEIMKRFKKTNVIVEQESFGDSSVDLSTQGITCVSHDVSDYGYCYIKYVDWEKGVITWVDYNNHKIYTTLMSDPLFSQDKEIE